MLAFYISFLALFAVRTALGTDSRPDCDEDVSAPGTAAPAPAERQCAPPAPAGPPTDAFCTSPPVFPDLDIPAYANGTWFQTHVSGSAALFSSFRCTTANYTLTSDGTVSVLNCDLDEGASRPSCVRAVASPRENSSIAAELTVAFPSVPESPFNPGRYNVAAVLGDAAQGYRAAAVYQCAKPAPSVPGQPGFFIIARNTAEPEAMLEEMKKELACSGYNVATVDFKPDNQKDCPYFFGEAGFDISVPGDGFGGPPPGVGMGDAAGLPPGVATGGAGGRPAGF